MHRQKLAQHLHSLVEPRGYLEIGVSKGASLSLARCPTVGVDPAYEIRHEVCCHLHLVRARSDDFFAAPEPLAHLPGGTFDLAFIDGMHLAEYALRDFINAERFAHPAAVILLDDMLPRHHDEAARDRAVARYRRAWAGDVFKVAQILRRLRPDLTLIEIDTAPTGTVVVLNPDPQSRVLLEAYDDIVAEIVTPDPQSVPADVLDRGRAIPPATLLESPVWAELRRLRSNGDVSRSRVATVLANAGLAQAPGVLRS